MPGITGKDFLGGGCFFLYFLKKIGYYLIEVWDLTRPPTGKAEKEKEMEKIKIRNSYRKVELSKQDEIDILKTLHNSFQDSGHYLEGLFSGHMVNYIADQIQNDHWPDLMSEMMNNGSKQLSLEYENRKLTEENKSLTDRVKNLNIEITLLRNQLMEANQRLENTTIREAMMSLKVGVLQEAFKDLMTI